MQHDPLLAAYQKSRDDLLSERVAAGHWVGELAASALSTATAISALAIVQRGHPTNTDTGRFADEASESQLSELIVRGLHWLASHQNEDGGWGDTDKSYSNIATTMLVVAAFHLTAHPAGRGDMLERAEAYIKKAGGIAGLRKRYGRDKTFAVPILTNCALAGVVPWSKVSPLPFEAACVPQKWYRFLQLPVVSYAIPALVAIGQTRFHHKPPWFPPLRWLRRMAIEPSLRVLTRMQPASGGFLEATPLTSFVVMSLASMGRINHPVTELGVEFLLRSVLPDGSWPIDANLATWNTTLSLNALAGGGEDISQYECFDWVLGCQYQEEHPFTGAEPGGWGWTDLTGSVPDSDDTPGALLALHAWRNSPGFQPKYLPNVKKAAKAGVTWLLHLQNRDGGWPTFCRGWGNLPFDRSGADLTAHVLRALAAWDTDFPSPALENAVRKGFAHLERAQRPDGHWIPLWFGNQDHPDEENPVYGTAKVLAAYRDWNKIGTLSAERGLKWLVDQQNSDGGWGGGPKKRPSGKPTVVSSVEETALAVEALLAAPEPSPARPALNKGLDWLIAAVEENRHRETSPIGFYFAKLWYYEKLYPIIFTVSALGRAAVALGKIAPANTSSLQSASRWPNP
ncbi:prenyltransferase/squalene oxidase repeat-containing protein [Lignipirellula cremea]|nr:prenyltransferase/squalene oxidase repeat-containing protein [Lignipirellula cremea]